MKPIFLTLFSSLLLVNPVLMKAMEQEPAKAGAPTKKARRNARQTTSKEAMANILARAFYESQAKEKRIAMDEFEENLNHVTQMIYRNAKPASILEIIHLRDQFRNIQQNAFATEPKYAPQIQDLESRINTWIKNGDDIYKHHARELYLSAAACNALNIPIRATAHQILGISLDAQQKDAQKAYKKLAQRWHPDKNPQPEAAEVFKAINDAVAAYDPH